MEQQGKTTKDPNWLQKQKQKFQNTSKSMGLSALAGMIPSEADGFMQYIAGYGITIDKLLVAFQSEAGIQDMVRNGGYAALPKLLEVFGRLDKHFNCKVGILLENTQNASGNPTVVVHFCEMTQQGPIPVHSILFTELSKFVFDQMAIKKASEDQNTQPTQTKEDATT